MAAPMATPAPKSMIMSTQGPVGFYVATSIFTFLNIVVVILRFWARKQQKQPWKIDDWLIIPAFLLNMGMSIAVFYGVSQHANGYPTPPMPMIGARSLLARSSLEQASHTISINNRTFFIVYTMAPFSLGCIKLSILFFYRRIFVTKGSSLKGFANVSICSMMVIVFMWAVGFGFAYMFGCKTAFDTYWSTAGAEVLQKCINTQMVLYATAISGFICDMLIMLIPIPLVWRLQLDTARKLAVIGIFLTGSVAVIAALLRLIWFVWENKTPWNPAFDQMLLVSTFVFWSIIETHCGLLAACLPTLRRLFSSSSVDSVIRSVRSKLSLNSIRSRDGSRDGKTSLHSTDADSPRPSRSQHSHAGSRPDIRHDQIHVERDYHVSHNDDIELAHVRH